MPSITAHGSEDGTNRLGPEVLGGDQVPDVGLSVGVDAIRPTKTFSVIVGPGRGQGVLPILMWLLLRIACKRISQST